MPRKVKATRKHLSAAQIRGLKGHLVSAQNHSKDGALGYLWLKTIDKLIDVCDQAIHAEEGHLSGIEKSVEDA